MRSTTVLPFFLLLFGLATLTSCAKKDPYVGLWNYEVTETPDGTFTGELTIIKNGEGYEGSLVVNGQSSPLKNLTIEGDKASFESQTGYYFVVVNGDITEEKFNGKVKVEGYEFPFKAVKVSDEVAAP